MYMTLTYSYLLVMSHKLLTGTPIDYSAAPLVQQFHRAIIHEPAFASILQVQYDATTVWAAKKRIV